jgi:Zn-finger nucleic acid-binding protein
MSDTVICLACGGVVEGVAAPDEQRCECPPPEVEARAIECPHCGGRLRVGVRACPFCRSTLGTARCAHCLAWNVAEASCCQSCGRDLAAKEEDGRGAAAGQCPCDGGQLVTRRYADWDVDECDRCGGVFVEAATLDSLLDARDGSGHELRLALPKPRVEVDAFAPGTADGYLRCPECRAVMSRQNFGRVSGVLVDVCRGHGVWFDPAELSAVLAFVARGGFDRPRAKRPTFAIPEGAPKGSFGDRLELRSYDGVADAFWSALRALWTDQD